MRVIIILFKILFKNGFLPIIILWISGDLIIDLIGNIKDALLPSPAPMPADGLPISPEWAFGWLQVLVNGIMITLLLLSMGVLWRIQYANTKKIYLSFSLFNLLGILIVFSFSAPALHLWINTIVHYSNNPQIISFDNIAYIITSLCQTILFFYGIKIIWQQINLFFSHKQPPHEPINYRPTAPATIIHSPPTIHIPPRHY